MDRSVRAGGWTEETETTSPFACPDPSCTSTFASMSELRLHITHTHFTCWSPHHEYIHSKAVNVDLTAAASILKTQETATLLRKRHGKFAAALWWRTSIWQQETQAREDGAEGEGDAEIVHSQPGWSEGTRNGAQMGAGASQAAMAVLAVALVGQLETRVLTFCSVLTTETRGHGNMAEAGRNYTQKAEKQGRSQHTLGSPYLHVFM